MLTAIIIALVSIAIVVTFTAVWVDESVRQIDELHAANAVTMRVVISEKQRLSDTVSSHNALREEFDEFYVEQSAEAARKELAAIIKKHQGENKPKKVSIVSQKKPAQPVKVKVKK